MGERITPVPRSLTVVQAKIEAELLQAAGIKDEQISSLEQFRDRVRSGKVDDLTMDYKRLRFARYLFDNKRIF